MLYREYPVSSQLEPFVECFWYLRTGASDSWQSVYPDGCAELVLNLGESADELRREGIVRQPCHFVYGPTEDRIQLRGTQGTEVLAVRFRPWGASAVLGVPGAELLGHATALEAISPSLATRMVSIAEASIEVERRISRLDACLRQWMDWRGCDLPASARIARHLQNTPGAGVKDLGRLTGWSPRTAQRHFQTDIGLGPKRFGQVVRFMRFMRFMRLLDVEPSAPLSHLAVAAGYYDQAHSHRDLRRFTGAAPAAFRARTDEPFDRLYGSERLEHLVAL